MRVKVLEGQGVLVYEGMQYTAGQQFMVPDEQGKDWEKEGLVEEVKESEPWPMDAAMEEGRNAEPELVAMDHVIDAEAGVLPHKDES